MKSRSFVTSIMTPLNKLKYPQKFGLISLLFILPLAVVIYLLVVELNIRIDHFGWREKYGTEYLRSLRELLEDVQQHRNITYKYISRGDTAPNNELLTLQSQIDRNFEALELVDQQYGVPLETTEQVKGLKEDWQKLKTEALKLKTEESYNRHTQFITSIRNLMTRVGDTSYLILDPELDSYYMMDTVLLKLPEAQELLAQTLIVGEGVVTRKALTADERVQLIVLTGLIKSNLEEMNANVHSALINNPAQNLKPLLGVPLQEDISAMGQFLKLVDTKIINAPTINIDSSEFVASGSKALRASFNFYDSASLALENLIQARIDTLSGRRYFIITFALGSTIAAFLIGLSVMRTISRPLSDLAEAAKRLGLGDLSAQVTITGTDEISQVGSAFNNMAEELQARQQRLADRTHGLEIIASLGERLNAILNLEELLAEVVNQVKDKLGYYHAHIYLLDDTGEKLVVAEGTGPAGVEMKTKGHNIPLDAPSSLVARAARTGQIVSVDNVRQTPDWLPNPLLPDTSAEMAVPITLGVEGQVVGVLDVQQDRVGGLDEGDANLLRTLANQVAVAIRNARLFTELETALNEARELQRRYIAQSWDRTRVTRKSVGRVQISLGESTTLGEGMIASAQQQALSHQKPTLVALTGPQDDPATHLALVAPVMLRDVMIGDLQLHGIDPDREWTKSELALINGVIDQVAQIAENLRLFEETRERATREQTIREITDKLRATPNLDALLETATRELGQHLGVRHTVLELGIEAELSPSSGQKNGPGNGPVVVT